MRLSLITPTHNPVFLLDAYAALRLQTIQDFEWVIVPNGTAVIPPAIRSDPRVKLVEDSRHLTNIGALKRRACDAATGDAFIEYDHDDLLVPSKSLETIRDCFRAGAGFVYSDDAVFRFKKDSKRKYHEYTYDNRYGWETYPIRVYGRNLVATKCFEVSPRSLSEIYFCPDHVRSWSRKAYYEAGGHNPELSVCDDQELMIKTYLTGAEFKHTGGCNYLYRLSESNTVLSRGRLIQDICRQLRETHVPGLVKEWLRRHGRKELNLTEIRRSGWDYERNLLQGFGDETFGHIVADNELQRLTGFQVREFMNMAYQALVPGGYLTITVPEVLSGAGHADVEWKSHFSRASMLPYTQHEYARQNGNIRCRFQQINCVEVYPTSWHKDKGLKSLRFELVALKGQRHPGLQHI